MGNSWHSWQPFNSVPEDSRNLKLIRLPQVHKIFLSFLAVRENPAWITWYVSYILRYYRRKVTRRREKAVLNLLKHPFFKYSNAFEIYSIVYPDVREHLHCLFSVELPWQVTLINIRRVHPNTTQQGIEPP